MKNSCLNNVLLQKVKQYFTAFDSWWPKIQAKSYK
jgi:hypothetical protein